jgi:hypothetical protein
MSKPDHDELVTATADYLGAYIGKGISIDPVIDNLAPETNISNLTQLLEYRFLVSGTQATAQQRRRADLSLDATQTGGITDSSGVPVGVLDFVSLLEERLRAIEPAIEQELTITKGAVDGPIDWNHTIKHRHRSGDTVGHTYAVRSQNRTIQTTQNRVLIQLLQTLQTLLQTLEAAFDLHSADNAMFSMWRPGSPLRRTFEAAFENPQIGEILRSPVSISERDIQEVLTDRRPLYREAATLLRAIQDIQQGEITDQQARDLFRMELFAPSPEDGTSDLFELYWIFQLLDQFDTPRFNQITTARDQLIANWETESAEYLLFNDWKGEHHWNDDREYQKYLEFTLDIPDTPLESWLGDSTDEFVRRYIGIAHQKYEIFETVFEYNQGRKRPDIVLLKIDPSTPTPTLRKIFIGEVKHTTTPASIQGGVQQLLEYGAHAKLGPHLQLSRDTESEYIADTEDFLATPELEMGYFIGDAGDIRGTGPDSLQICGYGQTPTHPFEDAA